MAVDITTIPITELLDDLVDSALDIRTCEIAIKQGIDQYSGGDVQQRLDKNKYFIKMIRAEIERRIAGES